MTQTVPIKGMPDPKRHEPLWDRVDRNRFRVFWYVSLFSAASTVWIACCLVAIALVVGFFSLSCRQSPLWDVRWAIAAGAAASALYVGWAIATSEPRTLKRLRAVIVPKGELLDSKMAVKDMAIASGMGVAPAFYLIPGSNTNAFVFHEPGRRPLLGVTQGFAESLTVDEQRAVFANLVSRIVRGDTMVASVTTALVAPLQAWRDYRLERLDDEDAFLASARERQLYGMSDGARTPGTLGPESVLLLVPFGLALVLLGEVLAAAHRRSQLTAAEKADAEGMLLLKDPVSMLSALERCVTLDNVVPTAGEALGELFYCWTGDSTNDEDDPEWVRVARLREVLGIEGFLTGSPRIPYRLEGSRNI